MTIHTETAGMTTAEIYALEQNWENIKEAAKILDIEVNYTDTRTLTITRMLLRLAERQDELMKATHTHYDGDRV